MKKPKLIIYALCVLRLPLPQPRPAQEKIATCKELVTQFQRKLITAGPAKYLSFSAINWDIHPIRLNPNGITAAVPIP